MGTGRGKVQDEVFEDIISDLSEEFQLDKQVIRYVIMNYYKNVRDIMRFADPNTPYGVKSIRLSGLGKFRVKNFFVLDRWKKCQEKYIQEKKNV